MMEAQTLKRDSTSRLKTIRTRYVNSFTMHGLHHIIYGTIAEKVLWTIKLTAAIICAFYISKDLLISYFNYGTSTVINIESRSAMQLPKVTLISAKLFFDNFNTFADCSSKSSKSYDKYECDALASTNICQPLPSMKVNHPKDVFDKHSQQGDVTCNHYMYINKNGNFYQTATIQGMRHTMYVNLSRNPLVLGLSPPGEGPHLQSLFNTINIDRYGDHYFMLEKTTINRLAAPYSNPPCVEQNTTTAYEKNLFLGDYSLEKCRYTCYLKAIMQTCGAIQFVYRRVLRTEDFLKLVQDRNVSAMNECYEEKIGVWGIAYTECANNCRTACTETTYNTKQRYVPNTLAPSRIRLFFYYRDLKETIINHVPSFNPPTLVANLGGGLGLMAGVSAISIVEIFVWFILFVVERLHYIFNPGRQVSPNI